eukprot:TRINITY_DN2005_c0_g1_i1.p1 TRINITY_DN2005_c0_g1~~TRINITY_DN2005_c0_g1_i1.p1  ORF type:complete len:161 (-),score=47.12 TRINITY_DN2005_c0_g1_i1:51-533(-)
MSVRLVFLAVFVFFCFSAANAATPCIVDLLAAGDDLVLAGETIAKAVEDCKKNASTCATLVSQVVAFLAKASANLADAVRDCGASNNTACAKQISVTVADLALTSAEISKAVVGCTSVSFQCVKDILLADVDLVKTVDSLEASVKVCGGSAKAKAIHIDS